jgi:hypothetical protein
LKRDTKSVIHAKLNLFLHVDFPRKIFIKITAIELSKKLVLPGPGTAPPAKIISCSHRMVSMFFPEALAW